MSYRRRLTWITPLLLWLLAAAVYWGAQDNQSLSQDARTVWNNPAVSGTDLSGAFLGRYEYDLAETHDSVRPVATIANRVRYSMLGESRAPYIWGQVALHALCGSLLCFLVMATVASPPAGLLSGVLFVVHPLLTASVLGLAGLAEQLALAFALLSLVTLRSALHQPTKRTRRAVLSAVLMAAAIGSKEAAFLFLPVVLLWILSARPGRDPGPWRVRYLTGLLTVGVLGLAFRLVSLSGMSATARSAPAVHPDTGVPVLERITLGLAAAWTNLQLLIVPNPLSYTYGHLPSRLEPHLALLASTGAGLLVLLVVATVLLAIRGKSTATLWVGSVAFSLLASLGIVAPIGDFLNERTAYFLLPSVLGLLSYGVVRGCTDAPRWMGISIVGLALTGAGVLGSITIDRIRDYKDQDLLIRSALASTGSAQAHFDLGNLLLSRGQYPSARAEYEAALGKDPELWMAWINVGAAFSREEDFSLAMRAYTRAIEGAGDRQEYRVPVAKAHFNRALILMRQNRNAEAVDDLQQTLAVLPDHLKAHASLAFIFRNSQQFDEQAIYHFRRAIELETTPEAKQRLEEALDYIYERQEEVEREKQARINAGEPLDLEENAPEPQ